MYPSLMKILALILIATLVSCSKTESPTPPNTMKPEITTASAPPRKRKRYICGERPQVVAVIDSGLSLAPNTKGVKLCKYGHKDFTPSQQYDRSRTVTPVPLDFNGHGTNVAGLIQKNAGDANFCMVIIKYWTPGMTGGMALANTIKAIEYATALKVDYINYSGGGLEPNEDETRAVKRYLNTGGRFVAAAGNENNNLTMKPYFPAMSDPRVISVGNATEFGERAPMSNYGVEVTRWEVGEKQEGFGVKQSGTSQAAAVATGKLVKEECAK